MQTIATTAEAESLAADPLGFESEDASDAAWEAYARAVAAEGVGAAARRAAAWMVDDAFDAACGAPVGFAAFELDDARSEDEIAGAAPPRRAPITPPETAAPRPTTRAAPGPAPERGAFRVAAFYEELAEDRETIAALHRARTSGEVRGPDAKADAWRAALLRIAEKSAARAKAAPPPARDPAALALSRLLIAPHAEARTRAEAAAPICTWVGDDTGGCAAILLDPETSARLVAAADAANAAPSAVLEAALAALFEPDV